MHTVANAYTILHTCFNLPRELATCPVSWDEADCSCEEPDDELVPVVVVVLLGSTLSSEEISTCPIGI